MDVSTLAAPVCEFDFNLPHGIENEDEVMSQNDHIQSGQASQVINGPEEAQESMDYLFDEPESHDTTSYAPHTDVDSQHNMNLATFPEGFSDDEDESGEKAYDRTWETHQARKASSKQKKSPRRSEEDDGNEEGSPRAKEPRKSLFGGPVEDVEDQQLEERFEDQDDDIMVDQEQIVVDAQDGSSAGNHEDMNAFEAPRPDIRHRMSSLTVDQQAAQNTGELSLGFGLDSSEFDGMSPTPSRAPSEDSVVIPPDDQVCSHPSPTPPR